MVTVPVNDQAQMDVIALEHTMAQLKTEAKSSPVVATAGTTDAGAIFNPAIRGLTHEYGAWLHIDAAWGGALIYRIIDKLCGY